MKKLVCELCGSTDLLKDGGVFVCQTCGCKYTMEEVRKMLAGGGADVPAPAPVKVDNSAAIANYLKMARTALEADNNSEAESYANKIIELDPTHSEAWYIKGEAAGWQSTVAKPRLSESVSAWLNAIEHAAEEDRFELREKIAGCYTRLFLAMVSLRTGNFGKIQSKENYQGTKRSIEDGVTMMNTLLSQGGVSFNRAYTYNKIAKMINDGAVDGYKDARGDFGPEHRNMAKWQWERFTAACDQCTAMLELALKYVRNDSLGRTICDNLVTIGEAARDSCSWKFNVNSWNSDHYDREYSFTDEAKKIRTKNIDGWRSKKSQFQSGAVDKLLREVRGGRDELEEARGREKYWEEHADLKASLEAEKNQLQSQIKSLRKQLDNLPISEQISATRNKINVTQQRKDSLGLFKGKEKKTLQAEIDQLNVLLEQQKKEEQDAIKPLEDQIAANEKRIKEIEREFTKSRGKVSIDEDYAIEGAIVDGKFAITPTQFIEHLKKVLPAPYFLADLTNDAGGQIFGDRLGLGKMFQVIVKDSSITGGKDKNQNSGFVILFQAESPDSPIRAICLENGDDGKEKAGKGWCLLGAELLLLCADTTRSNAESAVAKMFLDDSSALFGFGDIRAEYASYNYNLAGLLDLSRHDLLIRTQN